MASRLQRRMASLWARGTRGVFRIPRPRDTDLAGHSEAIGHAAWVAGRLFKETLECLKADVFPAFGVQKDLRCRRLAEYLPRHFSGNVYVGSALHPNLELPSRFTMKPLARESLPATVRDSIVLLGNNDLNSRSGHKDFAQLFLNSPTSLFIGWDFDNHHWISRSATLAAWTDVYVPAHLANLDLLTSFNPLTTRPVACGIIQWSRAFLTARRAEILSAARNDQPLGRHVEYPQFSRRNEIVRALSAHFPDVQLSTVEYHRHSPAERLTEWCGHMCHWIVPVGDDCPIRLFDALATGGVPLVPRSLIKVEEVRAVADHVIFYGDADIESPQRVVDAGNRLFRDRGPAGALERHSAGVMNHHMDARVDRILDAVAAAFLHADRKAGDVPRGTITVRM